MGELDRIQLPVDGVQAARLCMSARRPVSDPAQLRVSARRSSAIAAELRDASSQLAAAAGSATWSGAAADAFGQRLRASAPNIAATAERYDAYARTLLSYAADVEDAGPGLRRLSAQLADGLASLPPAPTMPALGATVVDPAQQLASQRQSEAAADTLLRLARQFADAYNTWADSVSVCVAGIRRANSADPTRDLHGWRLWEHRLAAVAAYADPVLDFVSHPSWQSASNALGWLGSNFFFIALAATFVGCPEIAAVCLVVAAVLSAAQFAVDAWRKWGEHEQVSIGDLIMDGLGALPGGRIVEGGKVATSAARAAWGTRTGLGRIGAASAAAMPELGRAARELGHDLIRNPREAFAPGLRDLPRDYHRSTAYGGRAALARRWRTQMLWEAPNAVLGMPQLGGTSTPQFVWSERDRVDHAVADVAKDVAAAPARGVIAIDNNIRATLRPLP